MYHSKPAIVHLPCLHVVVSHKAPLQNKRALASIIVVRVSTCGSLSSRARRISRLDSLRGSSVELGTIQRRLAWPLR